MAVWIAVVRSNRFRQITPSDDSHTAFLFHSISSPFNFNPHAAMPSPDRSTHFNADGDARMVNVGDKPITRRTATASALIWMTAQAAESIRAGDAKKGDVLAVARLAGISASKWTSHLIPLCHGIPIESVTVDFDWPAREHSAQEHSARETNHGRIALRCLATVQTTGKTGVEMEAMTAASLAALTVYDMLKSVDRAMVVDRVCLESKSGGRNGDFRRDSPD